MRNAPARLAIALLALLALPLGGCKLPYQIISKLVGPKATPTPTPIPAQPIAAEFSAIEDERVAGDSQTPRMTVTVTLPGTKHNDVAAMRVVTTKVVDDLGTNLVPENAAEAQFESAGQRDSYPGEEPPPVNVSIPMKSASRKAKVLKEISADVELYTPALDPAALVTIPKFLGEAGKPIVNPVLQAAGVEITILSKEQIEAERTAYGEKKRAEAKKMGVEGDFLETTVKMATESFLSSSWINAWLKVKDPKGAAFDYVYLDAEGKVEEVNRETEAGFVGLGARGTEPGPDYGLQVRLKTPKTFVRYTFTLRDVALP
ncbi:MAG: hypothetical protein IPL90_00060 [Holophagales bacterium]|nr:hypothetical protein [Holophagales bacterium]